PIYDPDEPAQRLPATYANYLVTNGAVIMPTYGQPKPDFLASQILKIAYPGHEIVSVDCRALIRQHGSLHCATMQIPCPL
ncbi:MAG: agmatine deiminase family protein, partial [Muribaculaceae bacterium]|nr:agmatine deiminase family protein [Muribaculaceae bacterium]